MNRKERCFSLVFRAIWMAGWLGVLGGVPFAEATHIRYTDLRVENLLVSPTTITAGSKFTLSYRIYNAQRTAASTYFYVRAYYTATNTSSTSISGDTYLGYEQRISSLSGRQRTSTYTATVTLPTSAKVGRGYIKVFVDYNNRIYEYSSYNNNNISRVTITVNPPIPDLSVTKAVFPLEGNNISQGGTFQGDVTLNNGGKEFTADFTVRYHLCSSSSTSTCTVDLGAEKITYNFGQGGSFSYKTKKLTLPSNTATGTRYIRVTVDSTDAVNEFNEGNNERLDSISVVTSRPELRIDSFKVSPASVFETVPINISFQISNVGGANASSVAVRFYHSTDATITTSDTYLPGSEKLLSLAKGATSPVTSVSIKTPATLPLGAGYIGMIVDYNSRINEANESNNTRASNIRITGIIDLTAVSLKTTAKFAAAGGTVTFNYEIKNTGKSSVSAYSVGFYHSKTTPVTASGTLLNTLSFSALSQGFTEFGTVTLTLPSSLAGGQGYIGMIIDPKNAIQEPNRTNNNSSVQILIAEDKDKDGFAYLPGCPSTLSKCDCNDNDKTVYPGAKEICDGKDNDCDGKVEGNLTRPCYSGSAGCSQKADGSYQCQQPCKSGTESCVGGKWSSCQGEVTSSKEVCDKRDNDCDGLIDEGLSCPEVIPEPKSEPRPEPVQETTRPDAGSEPTPEIHADTLGQPCTTRSDCSPSQICKSGACAPDPCQGVSCQSDEFCKAGQCTKACGCCAAGEVCVDGKCEKDLCDGVNCASGEICNPNSGSCAKDDCDGVSCSQGKVCQSGVCIDDPCNNVQCPTDMTCKNGQCVGTNCNGETTQEALPGETTQEASPSEHAPGDGGSTETTTPETSPETTAEAPTETSGSTDKTTGGSETPQEGGGGGGCGCATQQPHPLSLLLLLGFALLVLRRRSSSKAA